MEGGPSSLTSGGSGGTGSGEEDEREAARRAAREEQERIQEQYRRLLQRQAEMQQVGSYIINAICFLFNCKSNNVNLFQFAIGMLIKLIIIFVFISVGRTCIHTSWFIYLFLFFY